MRIQALSTPAILALADGSLFYGTAIGADGETSGEVVFNTAMTGYQEILTDLYSRQIVTLTYPHIGNTGVNEEDIDRPHPGRRPDYSRSAAAGQQLAQQGKPGRLPAKQQHCWYR